MKRPVIFALLFICIAISAWSLRLSLRKIVKQYRQAHFPPAPNQPGSTMRVIVSDPKIDPPDLQLAQRIMHETEEVAGRGNVRVTARPLGAANHVYILAAGNGRFFSLDDGIRPGDIRGLIENGFTAPPPIAIKTMSVFRSMAKLKMNFDSKKGDRIVVVSCPREDWNKINLVWPDALIQ